MSNAGIFNDPSTKSYNASIIELKLVMHEVRLNQVTVLQKMKQVVSSATASVNAHETLHKERLKRRMSLNKRTAITQIRISPQNFNAINSETSHTEQTIASFFLCIGVQNGRLNVT